MAGARVAGTRNQSAIRVGRPPTRRVRAPSFHVLIYGCGASGGAADPSPACMVACARAHRVRERAGRRAWPWGKLDTCVAFESSTDHAPQGLHCVPVPLITPPCLPTAGRHATEHVAWGTPQSADQRPQTVRDPVRERSVSVADKSEYRMSVDRVRESPE